MPTARCTRSVRSRSRRSTSRRAGGCRASPTAGARSARRRSSAAIPRATTCTRAPRGAPRARSLEHDRPKDLDLRRTLGAGYGMQVFESHSVSLSVRGGLDERYPAFGWGIKASFSPRSSELEFFHEQEGFWNLADTEVVVLRSRSGIRVPVIGRLKARAELKLDWERRPSPGHRSTDSGSTMISSAAAAWRARAATRPSSPRRCRRASPRRSAPRLRTPAAGTARKPPPPAAPAPAQLRPTASSC